MGFAELVLVRGKVLLQVWRMIEEGFLNRDVYSPGDVSAVFLSPEYSEYSAR